MIGNTILNKSINNYLNEIFMDEAVDIIVELPIIKENDNSILAYKFHVFPRNKYYFLLIMNDSPKVLIEVDENETLSSIIYKFISTWIPNYLIDLSK